MNAGLMGWLSETVFARFRFWLTAVCALFYFQLGNSLAATEQVFASSNLSTNSRTSPVWDMARLSQSPKIVPADGFATNGLQAVFFEGPNYHGKPTRIFAWLGMPKHAAGKKVPGIVLVHGGGGTAFEDWVKLWNERGYAAIAMDTCGCTPGGEFANRPRHEMGGPPGWGGFDQIDEASEDQWTYHAVASVILAHSLLRNQPDIDAERIGLTGISWGGYLTCIVAGVDARFQFAVPVYGCGNYRKTVFNDPLEKMGPKRANRWMAWWDPSVYLPHAHMSILWVTGSNDFAYQLDALQDSYRLPKGRQSLCVRLRMPHGHGGPGESPKEIQIFADSIVNHGAPLARITSQGQRGSEIWVKFKSSRPITKVDLNYTCDGGPWVKRQWESMPLHVGRGKITATLPANAKAYYLNLTDDRDCVVSAPLNLGQE